jgi:hypothetical protein
MPADKQPPYISVVVGARNDDHGGNMLRRMQAFVDAWIGQSQRYNLPSEIVVVEWNPPANRPRLIDALEWPADTSPCDVRFVEVPPELHRAFGNPDTIPLHQMIAKNVGIRRARGEFVIAMNLDIVCSAELMQFLAERRLETGKMYRIDRHDVASSVPAHASVDDLLAYCHSHVLQVFSAEGFSSFAPDGLYQLEKHDITSPGAGIRLGSGWYELQSYQGESFRWLAPEAELILQKPAGNFRLAIDLETGPSAAGEPVNVAIVDSNGRTLASESVRGRSKFLIYVPESASSDALRLRADGAGVPLTLDARMLNLRAFKLRWEHVPQESWPYPKCETNVSLSFSESGQLQIGVDQGSSPMLESLEVRVADAPAPMVLSALPHPNQTLAVDMPNPETPVGIKLGFNLSSLNGARETNGSQIPSWHVEVESAGHSTDWTTFGPSPSPFAGFMQRPVYLHTIASGDFTLLSRADWFNLRAYPEFTTWPMHIDALFCYSAHHAGITEVVLREPMRIFHIQHLSGAGWTPEGERERRARIESKGVAQMPYSDLVKWIDLMRRYNAPFIFCRDNWGLRDAKLRETTVPAQ